MNHTTRIGVGCESACPSPCTARAEARGSQDELGKYSGVRPGFSWGRRDTKTVELTRQCAIVSSKGSIALAWYEYARSGGVVMEIRRIVSIVALAGSSAAFGATKVSIVPREATIPSCGCATFQLFLEDTASSGFPMRLYQMTLPGAAEPIGTASGVVEHTPVAPAVRSTGVGCLDDQSPCVDTLNPDYVFAPPNQAIASKDPGPPPRFGALGLTPDDAVDVTVPRYLGELVYCASPGASGDFVVNLVDIGGASFLRIQIDPDAVEDLPFAVDVPGATIHVVELSGAVFVDQSAVEGANLGSDWSNAFIDL